MSRRVLPGFGLSISWTLLYLGALVLVPLVACCMKAASLGWGPFWEAVWTDRARAAYSLTLGVSLFSSVIGVALGLIVAWVLVRYEFPLKRWVDSLVDL